MPSWLWVSRSTSKYGRETTRGRFLRGVRERVQNGWEGSNSVEKWARMKTALCESTKAELGHEDRRQPDWFRESESDLRPLTAARNQLYALWLSTGKERDRKKFASAHRETRRAVRRAKDAWFLRKETEAERGRHSGKLVWSCIRDIQRGRRGMAPVRSAMVRDEDGNVFHS